MLQKQSVIEFFSADLSSMIEMFNEITAEFKSATKYEIRSHSENYQTTFASGKFNWSYLYLEPDKLNLNLQIGAQLLAQEWTHGMSEEEIKARDPFDFVMEKLSEESKNAVEPIDDFEDFQQAISGEDKELKFFAEFIMARFFNHLAYADHKQTIPQLLYGLLKDNKLVNLRKAIAIDPSVRYLPEVETYIENISDRKKAEIYGYIDEAMNSNFFTNGKNKYSPSLLMLISALDFMQLLHGDQIQLDIDEIYTIIEQHNLHYIDDDPDSVLEKGYLRKIVKQYLSNKVKESSINFEFLTN